MIDYQEQIHTPWCLGGKKFDLEVFKSYFPGQWNAYTHIYKCNSKRSLIQTEPNMDVYILLNINLDGKF